MASLRLLLFIGQFALADLVLRRPPLRVWAPAALVSAALWVLLVSVARGRAGRVVVAIGSAGLLVVQVLFFRYYHVFLDEDGVAAAHHMWHDVRPILVGLSPLIVVSTVVMAAAQHALLVGAPPIRRPLLPAALLLVGLDALPVRDAAPDVSALASLRGWFRTKEARAAEGIAVESLPSTRARLPNVLLILDESVRASDYDAETTPQTTALTPDRIDLYQMRSVASYTAIAVSSLLTSLAPTAKDAERATAPCLFDYVRAVRRGGERPNVAYLSAQTDGLFERRDVRASADVFVTIDDLLGRHVDDVDDVLDTDVDGLLAARVERELPELRLPLFAMVHLGGTHAPYYVDDARAPFVPYRHLPSWTNLDKVHAAYRDAIFDQDASVARVLRAALARVGDEPLLVVFTSDHGEAFGEHGGIHHGQSLYDEQIHVPAWILSRHGALNDAQLRAVRDHADEVATHLDLVPTFLDAYGAMDSLPMQEHAHRFFGRSLLRAKDADVAIPLTNCTEMFPCPVRTWGMLGRERLLEAQSWDGSWHCIDLHDDRELAEDAACASLRRASRTVFPTQPNGRPND